LQRKFFNRRNVTKVATNLQAIAAMSLFYEQAASPIHQ
jgi:hypothetical protein